MQIFRDILTIKKLKNTEGRDSLTISDNEYFQIYYDEGGEGISRMNQAHAMSMFTTLILYLIIFFRSKSTCVEP